MAALLALLAALQIATGGLRTVAAHTGPYRWHRPAHVVPVRR